MQRMALRLARPMPSLRVCGHGVASRLRPLSFFVFYFLFFHWVRGSKPTAAAKRSSGFNVRTARRARPGLAEVTEARFQVRARMPGP